MIEINHLSIGYKTENGLVKAASDVNLNIEKGKIVGLVGESGCGKSTALYSLMGLLSYPGEVIGGEILFEGKDLAHLTNAEWRKMRGKDIAMVFQDPMTTLNPAYRIGNQIIESLLVHRLYDPEKKSLFGKRDEYKLARQRALELMQEVGIPAPDSRYNEYPHQFSGGMQQRAIIAIALACKPKLLLADEPTTALDVTIQAQILDLLRQINETHGTTIIFVTHDLAVAAEFCDEIAVMYAGQIVERGLVDEVIEDPKHPYTKGLLRSIPTINFKGKLKPIPGHVIDLMELNEGCAFAPRCEFASTECHQEQKIRVLGNGHEVRCRLYEGEEAN